MIESSPGPLTRTCSVLEALPNPPPGVSASERAENRRFESGWLRRHTGAEVTSAARGAASESGLRSSSKFPKI